LKRLTQPAAGGAATSNRRHRRLNQRSSRLRACFRPGGV